MTKAESVVLLPARKKHELLLFSEMSGDEYQVRGLVNDYWIVSSNRYAAICASHCLKGSAVGDGMD